METTNKGTSGRGYVIGGRNIGSSANEPQWTDEDKEQIEQAMSYRVPSVQMSETRRSAADPMQKFVRKLNDGTYIATPASMLPNAPLGSYLLGMGTPKREQKLDKNKIYSDVIMVGAKRDWILPQWTSKDVVMEGVPENLLSKPPRMNRGVPERMIGHHFARFGLPKKSFAPIFETLASGIPGILSKVTSTEGYYWVNASWGVTGTPGTFAYKGDDGKRVMIQDLASAMRMIMGGSSVGLGTFAISTSANYKIVNEQVVAIKDSFELSIKCHNMFHLMSRNYHGPPQSASTGFEIQDDIFAEAEVLHKPAAMEQVFSGSADMFGPTSINPFAIPNPGTSTGTNAGKGADMYV
ncbi:hypothetical protein B0J12DRAFT_692603 [Macrophomina phaseolina]|uniref:Uncharacterized protein n=1 Tax=Macrophomina phaseolina TaxID=35725 RepID=A0ABQ8FPB1_9PEZI|nr:hypothetical protein B0J12DRAFT_692603 [Macrophomina phaseolina]